jgi:hypothetical protein
MLDSHRTAYSDTSSRPAGTASWASGRQCGLLSCSPLLPHAATVTSEVRQSTNTQYCSAILLHVLHNRVAQGLWDSSLTNILHALQRPGNTFDRSGLAGA